MVNKIALLCFLLCLAIGIPAANAQDEEKIRDIEKIKADLSNHWGEAESTDLEQAKKRARQDLLSKFKGANSIVSRYIQENHADGSGREDLNSNFKVSVCAILNNPHEINYKTVKKNKGKKEDEIWHTVFVYVTPEEYNEQLTRRHDDERELIKSGIEQERNACIAGALKYFNWAHSVIKAFNDGDLTMELEGKEQNCQLWLERKIESVLANLKFEVVEDGVTEHESGYDKYSIQVRSTYAGNPVSTLDVSFYNNEDDQETRAKDGVLTLNYPKLDDRKELNFRVYYSYAAEGKDEGGLVSAAYNALAPSQRIDMDDLSRVKLPFKYNARKGVAKRTDATTTAAAEMEQTDRIAPDVKAPRKALDRNEIAAPQNELAARGYIESMMAVEEALRKRAYSSVRDLFTEEGYRIFHLLTKKSKVSVIGKPEYSIEETDLFTRGKAIPIKVSLGSRSATENLVFRFDKGSGKISSVAFALTKRAEDDIFRDGASWDVDSRYSILTFMEDYQTAFHTQDTEYIKKIFSNDAIIITGKFTNNITGHFEDFSADENGDYDVLSNRGGKRGKFVAYKKQTTDQYLRNLQRCFNDNNWTHIDFEQTTMEKVNSQLIDNDIMWIELKQVWTSSGYCDVGYLALQINLVKQGGSKINVRVWHPTYVEIDDLKNRFKVQ